MSYGRYFDQFEVGQEFKHWPGRTVTEFDDTLFSLMCMNQHPLHIDENYARETQHGQRVVEGPLVISIVIGLTQADVGGRALDVLEYRDVQHLAPVFHGDTLYARSRIAEKQPLANQSDRGVVVVETEAVNQRKETILTLKRKIVVPRRERTG